MKTKTILSLIFISVFSFLSFSGKSQVIDSIQISPSIPGVNDTVKIYIYNTFNSGGCAGSASFGKSGFNISASSLHCLGALAVICHDVDTVIVDPPHALGTYRFNFVLNVGFSGPPCTPGIVPNDFDTAYYTVVANPPNLPPIITTISGDTICKNDSLGPLSFTVNDEDVNSVVITSTSDNTTLIPNSNLIVNGSGGIWNLNLTPATNKVGMANITVTARDNINQKDSTVFAVVVEQCTINNLYEYSKINITMFPNPANDEVNLSFSEVIMDPDIGMFNIQGQKIEIPVNRYHNLYILTTDHLTPGTYIISVHAYGSEVFRESVVIQ